MKECCNICCTLLMLYAYIKVLCYLNGISWWLYLGNLKRSCYVIVVDVSYISYALIDILQPHMQSYKPLVELYEGKTIYLYDMKFYVDSYNLRPVLIHFISLISIYHPILSVICKGVLFYRNQTSTFFVSNWFFFFFKFPH